MPAERFYLDADLVGTVFLEGAEWHHLAHVMRMRVGEEIELVNGRGALAQAKVVALSKQKAILQVLSAIDIPSVPSGVTLAIPLMRPAKLELVIEKGTELGADAFCLYPAQFSDKEGLSANQMERLNHLAIAAMKQCGRLDLPPIRLLGHFEELFKLPGTPLFGDTRPNAKKMGVGGKVVVITGPERGFSEKELELLDRKATGVRLHKNILRAETAPLVALCLHKD